MQQIQTNPNLISYRVTLHEDVGDKLTIAFDCQAECDDHAAELAEKAYPGCEIISYLPFSDAIFSRADAIKAEYLASGCQSSDVDEALAKLSTECISIFENGTAAWRFLMEEPHEDDEAECPYSVGDEVYWNDPDAGLSSGYYWVTAIHGEIILINNNAGSEAEVFAHELGSAPVPAQRIRLVLDVSYQPNGVPIDVLRDHLTRMFERAIGDGILTGSTRAEVEKYSMEVKTISPIDVEEIADFMLHCIEGSRELDLGEIPKRLAKYGLMDPTDFAIDMQERIEMAKEEGQSW